MLSFLNSKRYSQEKKCYLLNRISAQFATVRLISFFWKMLPDWSVYPLHIISLNLFQKNGPSVRRVDLFRLNWQNRGKAFRWLKLITKVLSLTILVWLMLICWRSYPAGRLFFLKINPRWNNEGNNYLLLIS